MAPGICTPPENYKYSKVLKTSPRSQWITDGGFCGSMSIQTIALSHGVYISQDLLRKAAAPGGGHGEPGLGYEILHTNIGGALDKLGFLHEEFDYVNTPIPQ